MVLEGAVAVAELADMAWGRFRQKSNQTTVAAVLRDEAMAAEHALALEKAENRRLRAILEEYKTALSAVQQNQPGVEWLGQELNTAEGTANVYKKLQDKVNSPEFFAKLQLPPECRGEASVQGMTRFSDKDGFEVNTDLEDPDWWSWVTDKDMFNTPSEDVDSLDGSGYIVIETDDVIDAMANFIAQYLLVHPDTKNMTPKQVQEAVVCALAELRVKGTFRRLWDWGKFFYTTGSWATTAFGVYRNPILVRGALLAIWTSSRIILALVRR